MKLPVVPLEYGLVLLHALVDALLLARSDLSVRQIVQLGDRRIVELLAVPQNLQNLLNFDLAFVAASHQVCSDGSILDLLCHFSEIVRLSVQFGDLFKNGVSVLILYLLDKR